MEQKKITLSIEGMFCLNCKNRIEQKLNKTKGIFSASVSFEKNTAQISYYIEEISLNEIKEVIKALGYTAKDSKDFKKRIITNIFLLAIIIFLYYLLQHFNILNLLVPSKLADSSMGYGMLFVTGIFSSFHCISMCGGINLSQSISAVQTKAKISKEPFLYNFGRVISYTTVGFILGAVGMFITGGTGMGLPLFFQGILKIFAGLFMLIMGMNMLNLFPKLRVFQSKLVSKLKIDGLKKRFTGKGSFIVGILNGFLPCGPLQSMQIIALGSANPIFGALSMFMFSLGTVPLMLSFGALVSFLGKLKLQILLKCGAVLIVVLGISMLSQGITLSGLKFFKFQQNSSLEDSGFDGILDMAQISEDGKTQTVMSNLDFGYFPDITVYKDIPAVWKINVPKEVINGCNYRMYIPDEKITHDFVPGENVIKFTPKQEGIMDYTCWMGMIYGSINVINKDIE